MDKSRLFARGGIRSFKKKFDDETEETFYYRARTPAEVAGFRGALRAFPDDEAGGIARDAYLGKFIVGSLCDEGGAPVLTNDEVKQIPDSLKLELCLLVVAGSVETGDAGKG